jgi:hypothetical protein
MAKIRNYVTDNNITDQDIVVGSDGDNSGVTKNFNVSALKTYITNGLVEEAPIDGIVYSRKDAEWVVSSLSADEIIQVDSYSELPFPGVVGVLYLTLDTSKLFVWNGSYSEVNQSSISPFSNITEGGNIGIVRTARNPLNYGDIGPGAIDFSTSTEASSTYGATGPSSFASGRSNKSPGSFSHSQNIQNKANGYASSASGIYNVASGRGEMATGMYGTEYTATDTVTDKVFNVGAGTSTLNKKDAFSLFRNFAAKFTPAALSSITNQVAGFFIFDSSDSNRPAVHNGTAWKKLAYQDDVPTITIDSIPTDGSNNSVSSNGTFDALANKVDKVVGKELSTNDYTTLEQTKLAGIAAGAEVNVNADWNATSGDAQILNKPTIPSAVIVDSIPTNGSSNAVSSDGVFDALALKADLVAGKVPSSQLPSYVDDVVEVANFAALPVTGETGKIYVTIDTGFIYRWTGSVYVQIATGGSVTSVGLTMPSAFTVTNSPITTTGDIAVTGAGVASQYVRGDGTLANFPTSSGGGSSVNYYLNGGTSQGTFGGTTYYEFSKTAVIGTGVDFSRGTNGYIASFITDVADPSLLLIPAGNWNLEFFFSSSSAGGSPSFYAELYKYDGTTFTLIASGSAAPEGITNGTAIDAYFTALAVPETVLTVNDRLAIRVYINASSKTITLHTQNGHLCEVITTFSTGLTALNGLTNQVQYFATGTTGTDLNISSATDTHTFNLPTASAANRGALSSSDWTAFNNKQEALSSGVNIKTINGNSVLGSGNLSLGTPLTRQEFTFTGSQSFTLSGTPSYIYGVFVQGQELDSDQYSFSGTTLTILNTLGTSDSVNILYTPTVSGILDYYTKSQVDAITIATTSPLTGGGDLSANRTISIPMADADYDGYLSSSAFNNFNAKQDPITLTTNNFSGVATFSSGTLNIPNYEGFIPKLRGHETFRGVNYSNNSTTEVTSGGITIATTGSTIARSVASTNYALKQIRKGFYGSVVSTGRYTGTRGSALLWYLGGGFKYVCDVYISDTAFGSGCRQFYGVAGQTTDLTYTDSVLVSSLINIIGVGSDASDTNLQVFHNDGTGTATKIDLGVNFPANRTAGAALTTVYSIELYNDSASTEVKYCVRNKETGSIAMGTIATNLPLHTQGLNFFASRCMGAGVTNTGQFDLLTLGTYSL